MKKFKIYEYLGTTRLGKAIFGESLIGGAVGRDNIYIINAVPVSSNKSVSTLYVDEHMIVEYTQGRATTKAIIKRVE